MNERGVNKLSLAADRIDHRRPSQGHHSPNKEEPSMMNIGGRRDSQLSGQGSPVQGLQSLKKPKSILEVNPRQFRIRGDDEIQLDVLGDFNDREEPIGIEITPNKPSPSTPNYNTA